MSDHDRTAVMCSERRGYAEWHSLISSRTVAILVLCAMAVLFVVANGIS